MSRVERALRKLAADRPHRAAEDASTATVPERTAAFGTLRCQPEVDRRAFPRRSSQCVVTVCPVAGRTPLDPVQVDWLLHASRMKGRLLDISRNGVAFELSEALAENQTVLLRLSNPRLGRQVDIRAQVVRTAAMGVSRHRVVCRFLRHLELEEVCQLGEQLFTSSCV